MRHNFSILARTIPAALVLLAVTVAPAVARRLDVEVWTDRGNDAVYQPGEAMRVKVRTTEDAYLLVYEIDSEGSLHLLFPWRRGVGRIEGRTTLRLPDANSDYELVVEEKTGQGFIVAVASDQPFRDLPWFLRPFDPQAASVGYEGAPEGAGSGEEGIDEDGRILGDPYVAMERIRRRVVAESADLQGLASTYSTYYVHEQVRYPRYICGDCHRSNRWAWWDGFDPYYTRCSVVDFRVNWSWCWGPHLWTSYVPYYYYVVRSDCPPRYSRYYDNHTRLSSWDGWNRYNTLWGGQLRRYKDGPRPAPAPANYTPPPPRGVAWRGGLTPPGFVPPDVRRQGGAPADRGWLARDRGDGKPVFRDSPRGRPVIGGSNTPRGDASGGSGTADRPRDWRDGKRGGDSPPRGSNAPAPPETRDRRRNDPPPAERGGDRSPTFWKPRNDPPSPPPARQDPPRQEQPRQDQQRNEPVFRQPPPPSDPPKWSPSAPKTESGKGHGGKGNH